MFPARQALPHSLSTFFLLELLFGVIALCFTVHADAGNTPRGDSVQVVLQELSKVHPELVSEVPETGRRYLNKPRASAISDTWLVRIQDAFYYDIGALCKDYALKYLADWQVLASKSARETFWGTSYLCNSTNNYFGIRRKSKDWICEAFAYCEVIIRSDPNPSEFVVFPNFETSLWMFIHTMYSTHFLARLPDQGERVAAAIAFERTYGVHYWQNTAEAGRFGFRLKGERYTAGELINTWSEHEINNLCTQCSRESDWDWIGKLTGAISRARE